MLDKCFPHGNSPTHHTSMIMTFSTQMLPHERGNNNIKHK
jgi:hypothetical protein